MRQLRQALDQQVQDQVAAAQRFHQEATDFEAALARYDTELRKYQKIMGMAARSSHMPGEVANANRILAAKFSTGPPQPPQRRVPQGTACPCGCHQIIFPEPHPHPLELAPGKLSWSQLSPGSVFVRCSACQSVLHFASTFCPSRVWRKGSKWCCPPCLQANS